MPAEDNCKVGKHGLTIYKQFISNIYKHILAQCQAYINIYFKIFIVLIFTFGLSCGMWDLHWAWQAFSLVLACKLQSAGPCSLQHAGFLVDTPGLSRCGAGT